jgi:hypothetical protein
MFHPMKSSRLNYSVCLLLFQSLLAPALLADLGIVLPGAGTPQVVPPGGGETFGWTFTVGSTNLQVSGLGVWDNNQDGLLVPHQVGIWGSAGLVSSVTVEAGTAAPLVGEYRVESLPAPVILTSGSTYTIGAFYQNDDAYHGVTSTGPVIAPEISGVEARYEVSGSMVQPTETLAPGNPPYVGPNFEFTPIPEPETWTLVLAGIAVFMGRTWVKRKGH